jgi:hypothetical protein
MLWSNRDDFGHRWVGLPTTSEIVCFGGSSCQTRTLGSRHGYHSYVPQGIAFAQVAGW